MKVVDASYQSRTHRLDRQGNTYLMNMVRPITRWRIFRNWIGWYERDTLRIFQDGKPCRVKVVDDGDLFFGGVEVGRAFLYPRSLGRREILGSLLFLALLAIMVYAMLAL